MEQLERVLYLNHRISRSRDYGLCEVAEIKYLALLSSCALNSLPPRLQYLVDTTDTAVAIAVYKYLPESGLNFGDATRLVLAADNPNLVNKILVEYPVNSGSFRARNFLTKSFTSSLKEAQDEYDRPRNKKRVLDSISTAQKQFADIDHSLTHHELWDFLIFQLWQSHLDDYWP